MYPGFGFNIDGGVWQPTFGKLEKLPTFTALSENVEGSGFDVLYVGSLEDARAAKAILVSDGYGDYLFIYEVREVQL